jgi:uncharacterized membrane protein YhaH (DUF805 family)
VSPPHPRRCPDCDAQNDPGAEKCWLCGRPLSAKDEVVTAELAVDGRHSTGEKLFAGLTVASAVLSLVLILGSLRTDPGIAGLVAMCVGPAYLATGVRMAARRARGKPFSWQKTFLTFVLSVSAVFTLLCLLVVAMVISFLVMCLRMFGEL